MLFADECVVLTAASTTQISAQVTANELVYKVQLVSANDAEKQWFRCSCRPGSSEPRCAHAWAMLMELAHHVELLSENPEAHTEGKATHAQLAHSHTKSSTWRTRLLPALITPPKANNQLPDVLEYHVELGGDLEDAAMSIRVLRRQRLKAGGLGVPRGGSLPNSLIQRLPQADQELLRIMERFEADPYYFTGYARSRYSEVRLSNDWMVCTVDLPVVLPRLAATGRVYWASSADGQPQTLQVDGDPSFSLELQVVDPVADPAAQSPADVLEMRASVVRRDERLELANAQTSNGIVVVGNRLVGLLMDDPIDLVNELAHGPILVERDELPELLSVLSLQPNASRFLGDALTQVPLAQPQGVVAMTLPKQAPPRRDAAENSKARIDVEVRCDYGGTLLSLDDPRLLVSVDDQARRRDGDVEAELHAGVIAVGAESTEGFGLALAPEKLIAATSALHAAGYRVVAEGRRVRSFVKAAGKVNSGIDWFEVSAEVAFEGYSASLPALLRRKPTLDGFVELDDGTVGILPTSWLRQVDSLRRLGGKVDGDIVRLPNSQGLLLDAMLADRDQDDFAVDRKFQQLRERLDSFRALSSPETPKNFVGELRDYQKHGLGWMEFLREFGLGGCLADDMGLGKTIQVLAMLAGLPQPRKKSERCPSLIVAPRSVIGNWIEECRRFAPKLRVLDFSTPDRWRSDGASELADYHVLFTTYALVRADVAEFDERDLRFRYVILDESQAIKNAESQSSKAVRLLRAQHRLALTGTPVENHLGELWALFEFLNPGMLGRLPVFQALFGNDASGEELQNNRELVQRALRPVMLRRTKAQVLQDLPAKTEQTLWCQMGSAQRRRYDKLRDHYRRLLLGETELEGKQRFAVLEALLRLRQATCHEGLLDKSRNDQASAKFDELLPRLEQLANEGHKALVFSQFTSLLDLLEPQLKKRGLLWQRIDGRTRKREERIEQFQNDPAYPIFLISLKAGGFGLNLTAASYVFLLDPWWNPAAEMQAVDRAHRIGQTRAVNAYRLVCRDTVEERVLELQDQKKALCEAILGNERSLLQDLSRDDLDALLR
jgi:superfamily II DNA or RNA helicase